MPSAVLINFGPFDMVAPAEGRLGSKVLAAIEQALEFAAAGFGDMAAALVRRAEVRLQITERDRAIARGETDPADMLIGARSDQIRRQRAERRRAISLIPHDEPQLTDSDRHHMARIDALSEEAVVLRGQKKYRQAHERVRQARNIAVQLGQSLKDRHDQNWAGRILGEIATLESTLGGKVEFITAPGVIPPAEGRPAIPVTGNPMRVLSRDGILSLETAGSLSPIQAAALLKYRELYERTDPERSLRCKSLDPADIRVSHGGDGWAEKVARMWEARKVIEQKVMDDQPRRALAVLHEVAGKGRALNSFCQGASRTLNRMALVRAADVIADHYGLQ